jgi:hypothetical protein
MLNIPGHKGNCESKRHLDSTSLLLEWQSPRAQTTNVGKDAGDEEKEPSYTVGKNVN